MLLRPFKNSTMLASKTGCRCRLDAKNGMNSQQTQDMTAAGSETLGNP
jgi:hypothetical protein